MSEGMRSPSKGMFGSKGPYIPSKECGFCLLHIPQGSHTENRHYGPQFEPKVPRGPSLLLFE